MDRLVVTPGLNIGLTELEVFRQAIEANLLRRIGMLIATEGVLGGNPFTELEVSMKSATEIEVAPGIGYVDGEVATVSATTPLQREAVSGTQYVKLRPALKTTEPGTIALQAGNPVIQGNGTRFSTYNVEDKIKTGLPAPDDLIVIESITSDIQLTAAVAPSVTQGIVPFEIEGYFPPEYPESAIGEYDEDEGARLLSLDSVSPVPGVDLLLATVSVGIGPAYNIESVTDARTPLRLKEQIAGSAFVDTHDIYANDVLQDHVDAVGSFATFEGWLGENNPHGISAADIPVPTYGQTDEVHYDFPSDKRLHHFLDQLLYRTGFNQFKGPAELSITQGGNNRAYYTNVFGWDAVGFPGNGVGQVVCSFSVPSRALIDWSRAKNFTIRLPMVGDLSPSASASFALAFLWVEAGKLLGESELGTVTKGITIPEDNKIVEYGWAGAFNLDGLEDARGRCLLQVLRIGTADAYTGTVKVLGVGMRVE